NVDTFKDLVELLLCDKLKSLMSDQLRSHITSLEVDKWLRIDRLCDVADSLSTDNMSVRQAERAASSNWRSNPSASNAAVASSHAQFNQSARYSPSFKANPKFEKPGGGGGGKVDQTVQLLPNFGCDLGGRQKRFLQTGVRP